MKYIYTNYGSKLFPLGVVFETEAEDIIAADKKFTAVTGKKMSDKECSLITTYSPDWQHVHD